MKQHPAPVVEVRGLKIGFPDSPNRDSQIVWPVMSADFQVFAGKSLALVGESGCGKTLSALSLMGLLGAVHSNIKPRLEGNSWFRNSENIAYDLTQMTESEFDDLRGKGLSMVFQEPGTSLNPVISVGKQIYEVLRKHQRIDRDSAWKHVVELLDSVGISDAERRSRSYPHEFSGGQRQRIMIAIAIALNPRLLIADEPTTALDVSIQAQVLNLIHELRKERQMSLLLITHNLGIVAQYAQDMVIMYAGYTVESGPVEDIFADPRHPYTRLLLASVPGMQGGRKGDRKLAAIEGYVPSPRHRPPGCPFNPRCIFADDRCRREMPAWSEISEKRRIRCYKEGSHE